MQLQHCCFTAFFYRAERTVDARNVTRPFFTFFFAGPRDRFARSGVVVDDGRFGRTFGDRLFGTTRRVIGVARRLAVLFLHGDLVIDVEARGDFVFAGVVRRDFGLVAERFVFHAGVTQPVGGVIGVGFGRAARCRTCFGRGFSHRLARALRFFVVAVDPRLVSFADRRFVDLCQTPDFVIRVFLLGQRAVAQKRFSVDRRHHRFAEPHAVFGAVRGLF